MAATVIAGAFPGCGGSDVPDPKKAVIKMFGAMQRNDRATLTRVLDLKELMKNINEDYALQTDSPRVFTNPEQVLEDLTGDGATKQRWFSYQRIIGTADVREDVATVEVTFVDKERSKAYLTRFGLHLVSGKWRIYTFKTLQEPPSSNG